MKKAIVLGLVALLVIGSAVAVYGKAQKVDLVPCGAANVVGFVVFNNSSGPNNLQVTVSLKKVVVQAYDIYLFVDDEWYGGTPILVNVTPNTQGNATYHFNVAVSAPGTHNLAVDIVKTGKLSDIYETVDIHTPGHVSATLIFK